MRRSIGSIVVVLLMSVLVAVPTVLGTTARPPDRVVAAYTPTAEIGPLAGWQFTRSVLITWSARPGYPVSTYDVRLERWPWSGGAATVSIWRSATTATSATFTGSLGWSYCFAVRTTDTGGALSGWSPLKCTSFPHDDRSLTRSRAWLAGTDAADYRGTHVRTYSAGATLALPGVVGRRFYLIATTCSTCGTVRVSLGSMFLGTVSLRSPTTVHRAVLPVALLTKSYSGTLTIRVATSGMRVVIDGVGIRR